MSVTVTSRLGVYQWSSETDEFSREQLNDSFAALENKLKGYLQGVTRPSASLALKGYVFFQTEANTFSYCDGTQWWNFIGGATFGLPSTLTMDSTTAEGTEDVAARADHIHGLPGFGTPASVLLSSSAGSGTAVARANHVHDIGAGAINSSKLASDSVDANALADLSVTGPKIANGVVSNSNIGTNAVSTSNIANGAVTADKLAPGAASGDKVGTLDGASFTSGTVDAARIPNLPASKVTSGVFDPSVMPAEVPSTESEWPIQPGQILFFAGNSAPVGYLMCDGSAVSRTTYSSLNSVLSAAGYPYGNGNGSSTFNLPDMRGRFPLGLNSSGTGSSLGEKGGSLDHTHTTPVHNHDIDFAQVSTGYSGNHQHFNPSTDTVTDHTHPVGGTTSTSIGSEASNDSTPGVVARSDISHSHDHRHGDGNLTTAFNDGHSHDIIGVSAAASPSYTTPDKSHTHTHTSPTSAGGGGHAHNVYQNDATGNHQHTVDLALFTINNNSGTTLTDSANPAYIVLNAIIKT